MSEMLLDGERAIRGTSPEPLSSRIVIRCYGSYRDAKRAYDRLRVVGRISDRRMAVVARGLEWQEPLGGTAALRLGAWLGALVGAWIGLILWALDFANGSTGWFGQTLAGAVLGAALGAALALAIRGLTRRDPAVRETGYVAPRQYDILVEEDLAPVAHEVLGAE